MGNRRITKSRRTCTDQKERNAEWDIFSLEKRKRLKNNENIFGIRTYKRQTNKLLNQAPPKYTKIFMAMTAMVFLLIKRKGPFHWLRWPCVGSRSRGMIEQTPAVAAVICTIGEEILHTALEQFTAADADVLWDAKPESESEERVKTPSVRTGKHAAQHSQWLQVR